MLFRSDMEKHNEKKVKLKTSIRPKDQNSAEGPCFTLPEQLPSDIQLPRNSNPRPSWSTGLNQFVGQVNTGGLKEIG